MTIKLSDSPIFILGLPRSSTSMIAGALKKAGAWTGTTISATPQNPKGFFEHAHIREQLIKKALVSLGCDPLGVRSLPLETAEFPGGSLRNQVFKIIQQDGYRGDRPWLYKDAKLTLLWPMFLKAFPNARWVYVKRDTDSFIDSCLRTPFMNQHSTERAYWEDFAKSYLTRINALQASGANCFSISTPNIIAGEFSALKQLIGELELSYSEKKLRKFIAPEYWHGEKASIEKILK
jgi:hypothetical protein